MLLNVIKPNLTSVSNVGNNTAKESQCFPILIDISVVCHFKILMYDYMELLVHTMPFKSFFLKNKH